MLLAHGSGIDDVLLFAVPAVIAIIALRRAEKRAKRRMENGDPDPPTDAASP